MASRSESVSIGSGKKCGGGTYMTIDELAPYGDESVECLVIDELFHHAGDLTVPARRSHGGKGEKADGLDLGALERDLLEY